MATPLAGWWPAGSGTSYDWLDRLVQVEKGANLGSTSVVRLYGYDESDNRISVDMQDLMTPELHLCV